MKQAELKQILNDLIQTWETEIIEFKQAKNDYSTTEIGKYFSALANEANLRGRDRAWLIFGVDDRTREVTGTEYRNNLEQLQATKYQISDNTQPKITFRNIHELMTDNNKRVILFEIPSAPAGIPISWNGHYYGRAGQSLAPLSIDKIDEIRQQNSLIDWSGQIVPSATLADLDATAIARAREAFALKHANRLDRTEVMTWSDGDFLERARLTQNFAMTRATLLLLGKPQSTYLLSPHPAQITWKLIGQEQAYEHFYPPFLLSTTQLYQQIRNIQIRLLPSNQLIPIEVAKYDQKIIMEALHNCIAHQDYAQNGRIIVTESADKLIFENEGSFFEGQPDDYIEGHKTPRRYRNPFLTRAMVELNMIDTMGYGIHQMHKGQAARYFPMPDYYVTESETALTIHGGVIDPAYSKLLVEKTDIPLSDILALDRVQKKLPIPREVSERLRRNGMIEGRSPHFHVSAYIAHATDSKAEYIRTRRQDDMHYAKLIMDYLQKFGQASRQDIDQLLKKHLSDALDEAQKGTKIANLLTKLRRSGQIYNAGSDRNPCWKIAEKTNL